MMTELTHNQFVEKVFSHYKEFDIIPGDPEEGCWDESHYPLPGCLGGDTTILLKREHHAIQGILQSEEYSHPCIWGWEKKFLVGEWEYLLPIFNKWMSEKSRLAGLSGAGKGGMRNVEEGLGFWSQTEEEWAETCRKGGETAGRNSAINKTGIHTDDLEKRREWASLGGRRMKGKVYWNNGLENKRSVTCPGEGWVRGIITRRWDKKAGND